MEEKNSTKSALISGVIGAFMGLLMSFGVNYLLVPFPETALQNAMNNGISGAISGFMGGFMGLYMHLRNGSK
jgi:hypothetical protein